MLKFSAPDLKKKITIFFISIYRHAMSYQTEVWSTGNKIKRCQFCGLWSKGIESAECTFMLPLSYIVEYVLYYEWP